MMISFGVVDQIKRLLAEGKLSQRKIARQLGVSRGTVHAIARGKRPDYQSRREDKDDWAAPSGPPARCPTCGGMVQMPCLACRVWAVKESQARPVGNRARIAGGRRPPRDAADPATRPYRRTTDQRAAVG